MNLQVPMRQSSCPSRQAWEAELDSHEPDPRLLEHLEQCARCRELLETVAAEAHWWQEASDTLALPIAETSHLTDTICPLSEQHFAAAGTDALCQHEIAQLQAMLPTASHPELLARIGRYELEQLVGRGGMSLVFRGRDTELHRVVAVKTLALYLLPTAAARQRFIREGRAAALLSHPHIVPMYDVITESPVPALVMQYIAGPTLEQWIEQQGAMSWQDALRIGAQLADALSAAHAEGLVHRDIKPSNVLLEADGARALLTDFGLVRAIDDATLTHSGMLAGTPHFMSPEQARGEEVDGRSDLFSLGSLLYFAMTGAPPFRGRESMAVLHALCHARHVPLCRLNREIPVEVSRLVDRLLAKHARHRPASGCEVRDELRELLNSPRRLRLANRFSRKRLLPLAALAVCAVFLAWFAWPDGQGDHRHNATSSRAVAGPDAVRSQTTDEPARAASSRSSATLARELGDFESLAHEAAEIERLLDQMQPDGQAAAPSPLWPAFEGAARQAAAIEAELERLDAAQREVAEY
ncbi:MAG: serine/threonine-protein kinase [Aureliella sp.]